MKTALIILCIIQGIRMLQNFIPIVLQIKDAKSRENVYAEFINNLKQDDRQWVKAVLDEFEERANGRV